MVIDTWAEHVSKRLFRLRDKFFELPYLYNSPKAMIQGLAGLPITRHDSINKILEVSSAYYKAKISYHEIDEGLWLLITHMHIAKNIVTISSYDGSASCEYYFLHLVVFEHSIYLSERPRYTLRIATWTINKPNTEVPNYFFSNTSGQMVSIALRRDWIERNFTNKDRTKKLKVLDFLNGKKGFYRWMDMSSEKNRLADELAEIIGNVRLSAVDLELMKKKTYEILEHFFDNCYEDGRMATNISLSNQDYRNVAKAEMMITDNLNMSFLGVRQIANETNTSSTKLKSNFKIVYGLSMLKYHKEKNLQFAWQLVKNLDISIKEVATATGYESASRFAATFKKRFGMLPSEARKFL